MRYLHTTIYVRNLETSIQFYVDYARLKIIRRISAGTTEIVFLADGDNDAAVELIAGEPDKNYVREGISIGFETDDLERDYRAVQHLKHSEILQPAPHERFFFAEDPDGVSVQFLQKL